MKKSILLLIVFILTSCATVQRETTFTKAPLQEEATVYLFRKGLYNGALLQTAKIYMDGKWVGNIGPNGYLKLKTPNSNVLLEAKNFGKPLKMNLDLDQGESYYFYVRSKLGWLRNKAYLESIPPEEGKAKINSLRGPKRKESVGSE